MEALFPCLGAILPLQYTKILWISAGILHGFPEKPKRRKSKKADCVRCIPLFSLPPFAGRVRGKPPAAHDHANGFRRFSKWRHRKQYCPSDLPLRFIPPTPAVWAPPAYGRGWPGSSGQHCLRPGTYPLLPTPAGAVHTQTFNQHHPPLRLPGLSTRKQFAPLPLTSLAGTTNLSSCMGLSTIIRHGAIGYRTDSLFQIANTL